MAKQINFLTDQNGVSIIKKTSGINIEKLELTSIFEKHLLNFN